MSLIETSRERIKELMKHRMSFPPKILDKDDAELLELMQKNSVESSTYRHCVTILQIRSMERTLRASNRLVCATWVLALVTILLALFSLFKQG
jgi:3'-phosphoadenosine 5'-phosphosulfate sulfotransferase (PAPS reductase)/FAD synthetase